MPFFYSAEITFINFDETDDELANLETYTPDGITKEYVLNIGHMGFSMKCAAPGGAETALTWTFTSRYLRNKQNHCNDAILPGGCNMPMCTNANDDVK